MSKKYSRRNALSLFGQGGITGILSQHPVKLLFTALLNGHISKANALVEPQASRNLLSIRLLGAPPRWTWDALHPHDPFSTVVPNAQVGTRFVSSGGRYTDVEYASVNLNGINMPWMWQFDLPKAGGGTRPMRELMDSMLLISGTNGNNPAHTGARVLQDYPLGINYSISSLAADNSNSPIPYINMNSATNGFNSALGLSPVNLPVTGANLLQTLLDPFLINPSATFGADQNALDAMLKTTFANLNIIAKNNHEKSETIIKSQNSAESLIRSGFNDIATFYPSTRNKYQNLIALAADPLNVALSGLSMQPIGATGDLRTDIQNVRQIGRLAQQFAVVEYVLCNNLSSSMTIAPNSFSGFTFDEHTVEKVRSLAGCTFYNRAIAACLLELIDQLKISGIFNNTIINISGEFGRNPKNDGTGSDHAPTSSSNTFFGGALAGNQFIGNTMKNSPQQNYLGSWGYSGENVGLSNNPSVPVGYLNLGHLAASIATMLNTPSPVTTSSSLLEENAGIISSLLPETKLV
jgi:hypothetical protein